MINPTIGRYCCAGAAFCLIAMILLGCKSPAQHRRQADQTAHGIIDQKQRQALGREEPFTIERPADTLRRRLLIEQELQHSHPAALGTDALERPRHWPDDEYAEQQPDDRLDPPVADPIHELLHLTLLDALQVAAANSREYQTRKENVFIEALNLDLERNLFRPIFRGDVEGRAIADLGVDPTAAGVGGTAGVGADQLLKSGAAISTRIGIDLIRLLTQDRDSSYGLFADASIAIPLLRGAGRHIVTEPLTQAERDVIYAMWDFETFKRSFAVGIADSYFRVLQQLDQVDNARESYGRSQFLTQRARALAEQGWISRLEEESARQQELRGRERLIAAQEEYDRRLDVFKVLLGLPADARVELDRQELERLLVMPQPVAPNRGQGDDLPAADPADPDRQAGDDPWLDISGEEAIRLAFEHRLDLHIRHGQVFDAQRRVIVAADALRAGLTLHGQAAMGGRRATLGAAGAPDAQLRPDEGFYAGSLLLDLPLERTRERHLYRTSLITLERATRTVQEFEDQVKLDVRSSLRALARNRESLEIQAEAVRVAERRLEGRNLQFRLGELVDIQRVLEAEEALITAQNAFTAALVSYRVGELTLQRDLGLLEVDHRGLWQEFVPAEPAPPVPDPAEPLPPEQQP